MASSLSNLPNNLTERFHNVKCSNCDTDFLEYTNAKDDLIEYKYLYCNKSYQKKFDENLKKRFANTYKFSNYDIN